MGMNPYRYSPGDFSLSPPNSLKHQRPAQPADLDTSPPYLPFAKQTITNSPVRRKPLPPNALSPSTSASRASSVASPDSTDQRTEPLSAMTDGSESSVVVRDLDRYPPGQTPLVPRSKRSIARRPINDHYKETLPPTAEASELGLVNHSRFISEPAVSTKVAPADKINKGRSASMASMPLDRPPPLRTNSNQSSLSGSVHDSKKPQTPGSKITSFFNWKSNVSPGTESSSTAISENGRSPLPSPLATSPQTSAYSSRSVFATIDVHKSNAATKREDNFSPQLAQSQIAELNPSTELEQLEVELREISTELAGSIRREMDLEDMVERLQLEANQGPNAVNRTSDYFSDSGLSSIRQPAGDTAVKAEDIKKIKRESEQQRAQLRVELSQKWQDERTRRKGLELQIQHLEEQVSQTRHDQLEDSDLSHKAKELENALDETRRRLTEERQIKETFEDLLTALRVDIEHHRNERDNLRDEVVPQLKAQLEGLEASTSQSQKLTYDYAHMQKEIQALRNENTTLINARKLQLEMQQNAMRINSIAEEGPRLPTPRNSAMQTSAIGLTRSNSLALSRVPSRNSPLVRPDSLSRSNSVSGAKHHVESRESLADRMKDVELQRDALHSAIKSLLVRQDYQSREYEKRIKLLELERDCALQSGSPHKLGYENEVTSLRQEINHLRQRADDALQQKWQCEKGLGGLKMDLDRSEQETSSLRNLLKEHDIAVPEQLSSSLQQAYNQLQHDRKQAEAWKISPESARSLDEEQQLGDQLQASAERSEALASQVRQQLQTNSTLRNRLADAVGRGERNQQASAEQISDLQNKLRRLEDTVTVAQQQSESAVLKHEEEIQLLQESHNAQLLRVRSGLRTPTLFSPSATSSMSQLFANGGRSPRLDKTTTGPAVGLNQATRTEYLENKVGELEKALGDADMEMEQVVGRMNMAQIEVAELQSERDEALRQTRRLQAAIMAEREKVQALMKGGSQI